ncbi:MAG: hypothetical protein BGO09_13735 [Bacteroidetes bacterium 47-18]|nr:MAG: hypothetical protein BGO09_13735 [Bacteroidetes bacterium 47-18]
MKVTKLIYIFLLIYIIAALFFWGLSLHQQNNRIYLYERTSLAEHRDTFRSEDVFKKEQDKVYDRFISRNTQYLGEGLFFCLVILIAAVMVYRSIQNNFRLSDRQNNFMLSITHELKSPIAAVKLNLETIQRRKLDEDTQVMLIERCINETNRLNDLCNNLLLASQMESKHFTVSMEEVDLHPILEDSVKIFMQRSRHQIHTDLDHAMVQADPFLVKLIINNLLENAVKYTLPGTRITVTLKEEDEQVIFAVIDEGGGIADEEKEKIFEKFYRIGNENSRKTKGTGLGLYLVSQIVHLNKGSISVRDNLPFGSIFEVTFPKVSQS